MYMNKAWMYNRLDNGFINNDFWIGVEEFVSFAKSHPECMNGAELKCPCNARRCRNIAFRDEDTVKTHICKNGFVPNYYNWYCHGEPYIFDPIGSSVPSSSYPIAPDQLGTPVDAMQSLPEAENIPYDQTIIEETPTPEVQKMYDMIRSTERELWAGIPSGHSQLSATARLLNMKTEHHFSERCYDDMCQLMSELLPADNCMTDSFYDTKKMIKDLGLPVEKIDCCINNCMIFWNKDNDLRECKMCNHPRFKQVNRIPGKKKKIPFKVMYYFPLTSRLQCLYASATTASHMRWHHEHVHEGDLMCHPCDSPAWKHLDSICSSFAIEPRNVRLGLSADEFQPFGTYGQQYSSWPVILTPCNLPPWMCMKDEFMFLTVLIPGPQNPKGQIDVFLQPLIAELNHLWNVGSETYDIASKSNFILHVALLWTISDFPAYSMLSGWSTTGKLACPHCMSQSDSFSLPCSGKISWFDNHRKFLPIDHPFRRNKKNFHRNEMVRKSPPTIKSGVEVLDEIDSYGFLPVYQDGSDELSSVRHSHHSRRLIVSSPRRPRIPTIQPRSRSIFEIHADM